MTSHTLAVLQAADDPTQWETPVNFDYNAEMSRVRRLQPKVEEIVGRPFEIDTQVQDASFFTDLSLHKPGVKSGHVDTVLCLRFSAFGNLFMLWSHCSSEQVAPELTEQIVEIVESHGFVHVELADLEQTYKGQHQGFQSTSWALRFFDYV